MRSSTCSVPMDRRTVLGLMPESRSSCSLICEWVVLAGWTASDLTSATLTSRENSFSLSMKALGLLRAALYLKGEYGPRALGEVTLVQFVIRAVRERRVAEALHLGMVLEVVEYFQRVLDVPLHAQRERFQSLQEQERVEGAQGGTRVPQKRDRALMM